MPPEFNNSTLPYTRTRQNASAVLFTNVTAALSKEGTILASRLKTAVIDPWNFTDSHINSVHPSLRYFGPLEKGLYTFTSPTGGDTTLFDSVLLLPSSSTYNSTARPLFQFLDIGVYNAVIFSDLGSSSAGTQLAVSSYTHIEFETTSSLFAIGVSRQPLEALHAAEVALLRFGHFHENPTHWSAIANAAKAALGYVVPLVAPYVKAAAGHLVKKGAQAIGNRISGDRKMSQASPYTAPRSKKPKPQPKKKAKFVRRK
jgi:hypothetical protein